MKKVLLYALIVLVSIFTFNLNVYAEEINENNLTSQTEESILATLNEENELDALETSIDEDLDSVEEDELNSEEDLDSVEEDELNSEEDLNSKEEILNTETKVIVSKVNEKDEPIIGSTLQILDEDGNVVEEWISDGTDHEVMLPAGKYTLHEVTTPEGYNIAEDIIFEVDVIIEEEIIGDADWSEIPCDHGENNQSPMYFIEINSVSYEVYCINQGLKTPDGIPYDGEIIKPEDIRKYTKQETDIDTDGYTISGTRINVNTETIADYDVSDQTMTNQELYDKILDIIYHRTLAEKDDRFKDLSIAEIRFITEIALKNYLNARITTYETVRVLNGKKVTNVSFNENGELWETGDGKKYIKLYNKFYNREYIYDPTSPTGYIISEGNGNSFGNYAKHWYEKHGNKLIPEKYAELFYYLIDQENAHPEGMQLFIYSPDGTYSEEPYQFLLGITGFIEDVAILEQSIKMLGNYSEETREIAVNKQWEDEYYNPEEERPESVTVNLYADGELKETVELNKENEWSYTFEGLKVYFEGKKIIYTIDEIKVPMYETVITGNMDEGFTIINTHYGEGSPVPPEDEFEENPETGDEIFTYIIMLFIGIIGMLSSVALIKVKNL